MMQAIVIDAAALHRLSTALFAETWFEKFFLPPNVEGLRRVEIDFVVYLTTVRLSAE
jgi:hypothetical protein